MLESGTCASRSDGSFNQVLVLPPSTILPASSWIDLPYSALHSFQRLRSPDRLEPLTRDLKPCTEKLCKNDSLRLGFVLLSLSACVSLFRSFRVISGFLVVSCGRTLTEIAQDLNTEGRVLYGLLVSVVGLWGRRSDFQGVTDLSKLFRVSQLGRVEGYEFNLEMRTFAASKEKSKLYA